MISGTQARSILIPRHSNSLRTAACSVGVYVPGFVMRGVEVQGGLSMSEKIASAVISRRRALSLMGLAALSLAVPPTVLVVSDAEAQQTTPPSAPETGTERRQERRTRRVKRRVHRRAARKKGRME